MPPSERARRLHAWIAAGLTAVVLFVQVGWLLNVFGSPDPAAAAYRDWIQFYRTGLRIVAGRASDIYVVRFTGGGRPELSDGFYFLYPPFVAWITIPLAFLSRLSAYLVCACAVAVGTALGMVTLLKVMGTRGVARVTGVLGGVASAPWNAAVILGHLSALLLLSPSLALFAWSRRRPVLAGGFLALLLAKPNWGFPTLGFLVAGRRWRMVVGFVAVGALLLLVSLPLGAGLWGEWWATMVGYRNVIADQTPPWKQATLLATIESVLGRSGSDPLVRASWALTSLPLLAGTALAWFRNAGDSERFPRLLGIALLAYDAVLVIPIGVVLWTSPDSYRSSDLRRWAMAVCVATWLWMYVQYFLLRDLSPSLAGFGLATWLVLELVDLAGVPPLGLRPGEKSPTPGAPAAEPQARPST